MKNNRPVIGITMGDPVGIGPEITLSALCNSKIYKICKPLVIGDISILKRTQKLNKNTLSLKSITSPDSGEYKHGCIDVLSMSSLDPDKTFWGNPTPETGKAMVNYILTAIDMTLQGAIEAVVTGPINKKAMHRAGFTYNGHTELFAERTKTMDFAMMMAGEKLRVVLVTIHIPFKDVPVILTKKGIFDKIFITSNALQDRFGILSPSIAVAGLNPHAGEDGIFGNEEINIIKPAIDQAKRKGLNVSGPFPPDTVFNQAVNGLYDAVICMYHDQGLIPFKMIHFNDGVNTTLGLPIIRTSVDHGTAYDIAGTGQANPGSLIAAINMAAYQAIEISKRTHPA
jgi:4-hydroxythreonine-4-phosphate dehydrogenase